MFYCLVKTLHICGMVEVTVAISSGEVVVGTVNSVVLDKIGASARKLGLAKKSNTGIPVVRGAGGIVWEVRRVELLKLGKKGGGRMNG